MMGITSCIAYDSSAYSLSVLLNVISSGLLLHFVCLCHAVHTETKETNQKERLEHTCASRTTEALGAAVVRAAEAVRGLQGGLVLRRCVSEGGVEKAQKGMPG